MESRLPEIAESAKDICSLSPTPTLRAPSTSSPGYSQPPTPASGLCTYVALPEEEAIKQLYPLLLISGAEGCLQLFPWKGRRKREVLFCCGQTLFFKYLIVLHRYDILFSIKVIHIECRKFGKLKSVQRIKQSTHSSTRFHTVNTWAYFLAIYFYAMKSYSPQTSNIYWVPKTCTLQVLSIFMFIVSLILRSPPKASIIYYQPHTVQVTCPSHTVVSGKAKIQTQSV